MNTTVVDFFDLPRMFLSMALCGIRTGTKSTLSDCVTTSPLFGSQLSKSRHRAKQFLSEQR